MLQISIIDDQINSFQQIQSAFTILKINAKIISIQPEINQTIEEFIIKNKKQLENSGVIICDENMYKFSGTQLIKTLKTIKQFANTRFISNSTEHQISELEKIGVPKIQKNNYKEIIEILKNGNLI